MAFKTFRTFSLVSFLVGTLSMATAHADIYDCLVVSPYVSVMISTSNKTMIVDYDNKENMPKEIIRNINVVTNGSMVTVTGGGHLVEINREQAGSDGNSDYNYPHDVKIDGNWGGCTSEKSGPLGYERLRSLEFSKGFVKTYRWPFAFGNVTGYRTVANVTLHPDETWNSISGSDHSTRACTLPKGKTLIPATAKKNEEFVFVTGAQSRYATDADHQMESSVSAGDILDRLYVIEENVCAYEHQDQIVELECTGDIGREIDFPFATAAIPAQADPNEDLDAAAEPLVGQWVFTQCNEGYWVWIHESILSDKTKFSWVAPN